MTGLNGAQDISVKVVSCRDIIQEVLRRNTLTPVAGKHLGELLACSLMMGDGLKGQESLQINLVGSYGLGNMMAITNGELNIRGMVGNPLFSLPNGNEDVNKQLPISEILGEGEIQIVRSHPAWKHPMNGITALRNTTIPINLALYMAESEQRTAALIADVRIENGQCISALGVMVETLPGASEENIETSISNLGNVQKKGLFSYFTQNSEGSSKVSSQITSQGSDIIPASGPTFRDLSGGEITKEQHERALAMFSGLDSPIDKILDDCLAGMDTGSIRWDRKPHFKCTCGVERVMRALALLPKEEVQSIVETQEHVEVTYFSNSITVFLSTCSFS